MISLRFVFGFLLVLVRMSAVVYGSLKTWASLFVSGRRRLSLISEPVAERLIAMKKPSCELTPNNGFDEAGPLDSLFKNMAAGQVPNFLEMMAALSEIAYEMTSDEPPCTDCLRR